MITGEITQSLAPVVQISFLIAPVVPLLAKPSTTQPEPVAAVGPVVKSPPNMFVQHVGKKVLKGSKIGAFEILGDNTNAVDDAVLPEQVTSQ